jgi:hypothetical protein
VIVPLVARPEGGGLCDDHSQPPLLVHMTLLGCKVEVNEDRPGSANKSSEYSVGRRRPGCGGGELRRLVLNTVMFAASAMEAGGDVALESMTVPQLKEELAARGSAHSGLKAALQRRLHSLLMEAAIGRQHRAWTAGAERRGRDGSRRRQPEREP